MAQMPPMMNSAPPSDPGMGDSVPPQIQKTLDQVMQGLGKLYMECHKLEPDSPLCDAVMSLQKATAEIAKNVGMPSSDMETGPEGGAVPSDAGSEPPPEAMAEGEAPLPPGSSIEDAAGATHQMMQNAAKRRSGK